MIVNLTPHSLSLVTTNGGTLTVPPSGAVARVASTTRDLGVTPEGVRLTCPSFGAVEGLPGPQEGTLYVVSALVRAAVPGRSDVASPGDLVRDAEGRVVGASSLHLNG